MMFPVRKTGACFSKQTELNLFKSIMQMNQIN